MLFVNIVYGFFTLSPFFFFFFFFFFFLFIFLFFFFFFFSSRRRHTRLTCDWSSDVCSSDLLCCAEIDEARALAETEGPAKLAGERRLEHIEGFDFGNSPRELEGEPARSEERRVGKECRSRWSPDH